MPKHPGPLPRRLRRLGADLRNPAKRDQALRRIRRRVALGLPDRSGVPEAGRPTSSAADAPRGRTAPAVPAPSPLRPDGPSIDGRWATGWSFLAGRVQGSPAAIDLARYDAPLVASVAAQADRHRGQAELATALAEGEPLVRAVRRAVVALCAVSQWTAAWSLTEGVRPLPDGEQAAVVGQLVLLHRRRQFARLWARLATVPFDQIVEHLPVEAADAALAEGAEDGLALAQRIAEHHDQLQTSALVELAGRFLAVGDRGRTETLAAEVRRRADLVADERIESSWVEVESYLNRPTPRPAGTAISVGVLDYQSPDQVLASGNLGDYVQTLGLLSNLARLSSVEFTGEDGLGALMGELQERVRPELRLPDVGGAVELVRVDRDFSSGAELPDPTWMIAFGWQMHPIYDIRFDFPYHRNIRPLFLSVHINRLGMLSEEGLDYLRRFGPVGCRDWPTVYLLLSAGVDAFFTGCLTTTVDAVFPERSAVYRGEGPHGLVDITAPAARYPEPPLVEYTHQDDEVRRMPLADGVRAAVTRLQTYQTDFRAASTRRLHAFLPMVALGVPVSFLPANQGDPRFVGLRSLETDRAYLRRTQKRLRGLVAEAMTLILSGADEDTVYAAWRAATAERVEKAKARYRAELPAIASSTAVESSIKAARIALRAFGQAAADRDGAGGGADVVLCFDDKLAPFVPVTIQSIVDHASGPVRFHLLTRGVGSAFQNWLAGCFPDVALTFLPCDDIDHGKVLRLPERITVSTMDRLLLPHLLSHVDRAIYLDIDTVVRDDITELARLDLEGHPVAARDSNIAELLEWRSAVARLPGTTANEVLIRTARRNGFGHQAINAGVLVLDLARMRADDFTATYLGWVERYGFHDQDVMLAYAGADRVHLPPRWNALPVLEDIEDPAIIHWAALPKPWESELTYRQEEWWTIARRVAERCGSAPDPSADASADGAGRPEPDQIGAHLEPLEVELEKTIEQVDRSHLSYLGATALRTLAAAVIDVEAAGVPGVLIETGTAMGGSAIVMARAKSPGRRLRVYDVFGMIPPPGERDGSDVHTRYAAIVAGESTGLSGELYYGYRDDLLAEVTGSFADHDVPIGDHDVELIPGLFADTLVVEEPVALAHLDGDWYESTMTCLTRIVPRLSPGGRLVIDDYDLWSGCRQAVDEFFAGRPGFRFERRGKLHIVREPEVAAGDDSGDAEPARPGQP